MKIVDAKEQSLLSCRRDLKLSESRQADTQQRLELLETSNRRMRKDLARMEGEMQNASGSRDTSKTELELMSSAFHSLSQKLHAHAYKHSTKARARSWLAKHRYTLT